MQESVSCSANVVVHGRQHYSANEKSTGDVDSVVAEEPENEMKPRGDVTSKDADDKVKQKYV